ncbi:MAG: hypothetical protein R2856_26535 [Caldilineaceae bacterium]
MIGHAPQETWPRSQGHLRLADTKRHRLLHRSGRHHRLYPFAQHFDDTQAEANAIRAALQVMEDGRQFESICQSGQAYLDPRGYKTGLSIPVFYGWLPSATAMREQTDGSRGATSSKTGRTGLRWWYLTTPAYTAKWAKLRIWRLQPAGRISLAHAYIQGDTQEQLRAWLIAWTVGDLYSIKRPWPPSTPPQNPEPIYQLHAPLVPNEPALPA